MPLDHCLVHSVVDSSMLRLAEILRTWEEFRRRIPIETLAARAARQFGERGDGVFSTAYFQSAVQDEIGLTPTSEVVVELLRAEPRIVRLSGGCHWMILPGEHKRYMED